MKNDDKKWQSYNELIRWLQAHYEISQQKNTKHSQSSTEMVRPVNVLNFTHRRI